MGDNNRLHSVAADEDPQGSVQRDTRVGAVPATRAGDPGTQQADPAGGQGGQGSTRGSDAGMNREVGNPDDLDTDDDDALPGHMGGGLAGG